MTAVSGLSKPPWLIRILAMGRIPKTSSSRFLTAPTSSRVIERRVPEEGGINYQARCPFHKREDPPSRWSPTKQFYHCFGCGAHGTAISFSWNMPGYGLSTR